MSRKTYSLSAVAVLATAGLSFSSADGAVAVAQDVAADAGALVQAEAPTQVEPEVEVMPELPAQTQPVFVSEEVVQAVPVVETPDLNAGSLSELVGQIDTNVELTEQMQCLAGAVYFESRGEPLAGQLAVAQVVINRAEDRRWPASYCGVVYQRAQFSFVRGGRMPRINTSSQAWRRAVAVAQIAHDGLWESEAAEAVYFHASYVRPRWSRSKTRVAQIDTHVFYR